MIKLAIFSFTFATSEARVIMIADMIIFIK